MNEEYGSLASTRQVSIPLNQETCRAHQAFGRYDMAILEGLVLADVADGQYELIALPLRLAGFDASPVRAILRSLS